MPDLTAEVIDEPVLVDESVSTDPVAVADPPPEPAKAAPAPTMEDTIRAKFRELSKPIPDASETPPEGQIRGSDGRFIEDPAKKAKPAIGKAADGVQPAAPAVAKAVESVKPARGAADTTKAPTSWRGGAATKFATADPELQAEVHKREADFHQGLQEQKPFADLGRSFHAEFQPYEALIRASGHTPQSLTRAWMNTEYQLKSATPEGKAALFVKYAKDYGIDMAMIQEAATKVAAGQAVEPVVDPRFAALEKTLQQVTTHIESSKTEAAQREFKVIESETQAFGQKPENKHFQAVRLDMAALMESGRAESLQDAYDKAVWANPETRKLMLAEQQVAESAKAAEKAALARKAAVTNVATRGTPPAARPATQGGGTMEDTIRANLRAIQARTSA